MKKLVIGSVLGVMLLGGVFLVQDNEQEKLVYGELEPSVLSISNPVSTM